MPQPDLSPQPPAAEPDQAPATLSVSERTYAASPLLHRHSYYQIFFTLRGALHMHMEDRRLTVEPATWALLPPGTEHVFWSEVPTSCLVINLATPAMALHGEPPRAEGSPLRPVNGRLLALADLLTSELHAGGYGEPLIAESLAAYVSATVRLALRPGQPEPAQPPAMAPAARARAYLEAHALDPVSLADVAAAAGTSVAHLQRSFRAAYGLTVVDQLQLLRVQYARRLLRESDMPVDVVAAAAGFASPSYFSRLFTRLVGATPARYRRER